MMSLVGTACGGFGPSAQIRSRRQTLFVQAPKKYLGRNLGIREINGVQEFGVHERNRWDWEVPKKFVERRNFGYIR